MLQEIGVIAPSSEVSIVVSDKACLWGAGAFKANLLSMSLECTNRRAPHVHTKCRWEVSLHCHG